MVLGLYHEPLVEVVEITDIVAHKDVPVGRTPSEHFSVYRTEKPGFDWHHRGKSTQPHGLRQGSIRAILVQKETELHATTA